MSYPHIAPDREYIANNKTDEPEGERLRAELEAWLEKNGIVAIFLDTDTHQVDIQWGSRLPDIMKQVLSKYGAITVIDREALQAQEQRRRPRREAQGVL